MNNAKETRPNYDRELSVGTYAGKKIYEAVVSLVSTALGVWGGIAAAGKLMKPKEIETLVDGVARSATEATLELPGVIGKLPGLRGAFTQRQLAIGGGTGLVVGSLAGGLVLGYEHWQKVKREQMQVDEITQDISDIEVFKKTDPELKAENERLWAQVNKHGEAGKSHAERHAPKHDKHSSHADAVRAEQAEFANAEHEI